jgi:hypothetical protein
LAASDIRGNKAALFSAVSLQAADREALGKFRWMVWKVFAVGPVAGGENTAFLKLQVECVELE